MSKYFNKTELTQLFAFVALFLAGAILLIGAIFPELSILNILNIIKDASLLLAIMIPAHAYARRFGNVWVIIYWVLVVLFIAAFIINGTNLF